MNEGSWCPPKWIYRDKRPVEDDVYFENMTRVIFLAGLSWKMVDQKWPCFKKAFKDFSVDAVAQMGDKDVQQLMGNEEIVRNRAKIVATINNAKQFQWVRREHGTFKNYLGSLDKSDSYALVVKELGNKFSRIGPSSARIFLYSVGENIKRPME
jgi:3-methyladenine DNA glycosylase Tag